MPDPSDFIVSTLGTPSVPSALQFSKAKGDAVGGFVSDNSRLLYDIELAEDAHPRNDLCLEMAGPRELLFFQPARTKVAIVTCGGLCPGMNNVIRSAFNELHYRYGVAQVLGIRFGFQGLNPDVGLPPTVLTSDFVDEIQKVGGAVLGTSRGPQDPAIVAEYLVGQGIDILFCVGGDGTQRAAHQICAEIRRRGLPIAIVGIPKTIDNDIKFVWRTFGFETALENAREVIDSAHAEAKAARNGIGLVKLMGREAGFIAAAAALASGQVNFALIPEVPFELEGPDGLLTKLRKRIESRGHAVIVVAEGAGQEHVGSSADAFDASGNRILADIGTLLKREITRHFQQCNVPVTVKYLDPSYHIRSVPANCADSLHCDGLARSAVHAAMAGKTDLLIGHWHNRYVHVPLAASIGVVKRISPRSDLWMSVLAATGQDEW